MGRSAKFYKRPSKKQKEVIKLTKPDTIKKAGDEKKQAAQHAAQAVLAAVAPTATSTKAKARTPKAKKADEHSMDVDTPAARTKKPADEPLLPEKPDYVDLLAGKKTYKRVPSKRR